jgi:hypothetical protein
MNGEARDRFGDALVALPAELAVRERSDGAVEVRYVEAGGDDAPGLPGGVICVVSGEPGDPLLDEVREAAGEGDAAAVSKALEGYEERLKRAGEKVARAVAAGSVAKAVASLPAITELRYRGKPVVEAMIVHPEMRSMRALVPYAGGTLDPAAFVASTYVRRGVAAEVETVVVVREPELTPFERKVVDRLPEEVDQLALGAPGGIASLSLAGGGLALAAGVYVDWGLQADDDDDVEQAMAFAEIQADQAEQHWEEHHGGLFWLDRHPELTGPIAQMTAGAAVQALVQIRTELMLQGQLR